MLLAIALFGYQSLFNLR